jgi:hypothetical protein
VRRTTNVAPGKAATAPLHDSPQQPGNTLSALHHPGIIIREVVESPRATSQCSIAACRISTKASTCPRRCCIAASPHPPPCRLVDGVQLAQHQLLESTGETPIIDLVQTTNLFSQQTTGERWSTQFKTWILYKWVYF